MKNFFRVKITNLGNMFAYLDDIKGAGVPWHYRKSIARGECDTFNRPFLRSTVRPTTNSRSTI